MLKYFAGSAVFSLILVSFFVFYSAYTQTDAAAIIFLLSLVMAPTLARLWDRSIAKNQLCLPENIPLIFSPGSRAVSRFAEAGWCIVVFGIVVFLRIYRWDTVPQGLWIDEVHAARNIFKIIDDGAPLLGSLPLVPRLPDWVHTFNLYSYMVMPIFWFTGGGLLGIKMLSILPATLSLGALYWFLRELSGNIFALIGTLLLGTSFWHLMHSRLNWDVTLLVFGSLLGLAAVIRAFRIKSMYWFAISGVFFGLTQFTYLGSRLCAAGLFGSLLLLLCLGQSKCSHFRSFIARGLVAWMLSFCVTAMPVVVFSTVTHTAIASSRVRDGAPSGFQRVADWENKSINLDRLLKSTRKHLNGFYETGSSGARRNIPGKSLLPLFWVISGVVGALLHLLLLRRGVGHSIFWVMFCVTMLNGILAGSRGLPVQRYALSIVIAFCWGAFTLTTGVQLLLKWLNSSGKNHRASGWLLSVALTMIAAFSYGEVRAYFDFFGNSLESRSKMGRYEETRIYRELKPFAGKQPIAIDSKLEVSKIVLEVLFWSPRVEYAGEQSGGFGNPPFRIVESKHIFQASARENTCRELLVLHRSTARRMRKAQHDCALRDITTPEGRLLFTLAVPSV